MTDPRRMPECQRCGAVIPAKRRSVSGFCTDKCAERQRYEDEASAAAERVVQENAPQRAARPSRRTDD